MSRPITIQNLSRIPYIVQYTNSLGQRIATPIITESFATFDIRLVSNSGTLNNVLILKINNLDRVIDFSVTPQGIFLNPRPGADGLVTELGDFILVIQPPLGSGNPTQPSDPNDTKNYNIHLNIDLTIKNKNKKNKKKIKKLIQLLEKLSELND